MFPCYASWQTDFKQSWSQTAFQHSPSNFGQQNEWVVHLNFPRRKNSVNISKGQYSHLIVIKAPLLKKRFFPKTFPWDLTEAPKAWKITDHYREYCTMPIRPKKYEMNGAWTFKSGCQGTFSEAEIKVLDKYRSALYLAQALSFLFFIITRIIFIWIKHWIYYRFTF